MPLSLSVLVDLGYALRVQKESHEAKTFFNLKTTACASGVPRTTIYLIVINTQMVAVALGPWASHSEDRAEP